MADDNRRDTEWDRGYRRYRDADERRYGAGDYDRHRGGGSYHEPPQFARPSSQPYRTPDPRGAADYEQRQGHPDQRGRHPDHHRGFWNRAGDELASWLGDRGAEQRRDLDRFEAGAHRGRGPSGYKRSDARIAEDVNDRLTDDAWVDATGVTVEVKDAEVTLNGIVHSREDKRRAEDFADRISGVVHVQNNLRIQRPSGDEAGQPLVDPPF